MRLFTTRMRDQDHEERRIRRPRRAVLAVAVLLTSTTLTTSAVPALAATTSVTRVKGGDRIETATVVARTGWSTAPRVLLATSQDYPDAVAAAAYAASLDAPLLLTSPTLVADTVVDALRDLRTERVTILGGLKAVSADVEQQLKSLGMQVDRVAGSSRYATAAALGDQVARRGPVGVVAIALGDRADGRDAWPDALAAASLAALDEPIPTLLTRRTELPDETRKALERLSPSKVVILGGESAIGYQVADALQKMGLRVERLDGTNRYDTAVNVAMAAIDGPDKEHGELDPTQAVFVSGESFADALGAGALAVRLGAPLLLVPAGVLADEVDAFVRDGATSLTSGFVVGGTKAIGEFVSQEIAAAIDGDPRPAPPAPKCPANSSPDCQYTYRHPISTWEQLAECESHQQWNINSGNGYYGGLQFSLGTWQNVGGAGYPHENSKWEQIHRGEILQERSGWGQWPHCSRELGLS